VRGTDQVCLCFFGDGAVNQGTFHESLNMASLWKLPVIYLCENNGYAITTSLAMSHGQPDIARRAEGYGMPGIAIDGQDIAVVYEATSEAVRRARRGEGPTLIEAKTYRFDEHQVGLVVPGGSYRPAAEIEHHKSRRDPLVLFRKVLLDTGCSESHLAAVEAEVNAAVASAIQFAEDSPLPELSSLYDYLYSQPVAGARR